MDNLTKAVYRKLESNCCGTGFGTGVDKEKGMQLRWGRFWDGG